MSAPTPGPIARRFLRLPTHLYDHGFGWLLGRRFLLLTHVGRLSGRHYRTVLEIIGADKESGEVLVIAGWGRRANWYRNLRAGPAIEVVIGRRRFRPVQRQLDEAEAAEALAKYERHNRIAAPVVRRVFSWLVGWRYDGSDKARQRIVTELPVIAFRPANEIRNVTARSGPTARRPS